MLKKNFLLGMDTFVQSVNLSTGCVRCDSVRFAGELSVFERPRSVERNQKVAPKGASRKITFFFTPADPVRRTGGGGAPPNPEKNVFGSLFLRLAHWLKVVHFLHAGILQKIGLGLPKICSGRFGSAGAGCERFDVNLT